MATDDTAETPVSRAIKRRKELQDTIRVSMQEIEKLDNFLRVWRDLSAAAAEEIKGAGIDPAPNLLLARAGYGQTQSMFEHYVQNVLREVGRPMQSSEIIQAFKERGHPIGGNETRTAWNRLWEAKNRGILKNIPRYGYWLASEPVPDAVLAGPPPKRRKSSGTPLRESWAGRPMGRKRVLSESQIKMLEEWFSEGKKTRKEMASDLGGISLATINNYRLAWLKKRTGSPSKKKKK